MSKGKYMLEASAIQQGCRTLTIAYTAVGMVNVTIQRYLVFHSRLSPISRSLLDYPPASHSQKKTCTPVALQPCRVTECPKTCKCAGLQ